MPTEDEMTIDERRKYLKRMKPRYVKAKREERSALLNETEQVTGIHRKSLTHLMHAEGLDPDQPRQLREDLYQSLAQVWSQSLPAPLEVA